MTQEIIDAVKEAKEQAKPRNFTQSIDVIINLKDLDVRKPENRFSEEVALPNGRGKEIKIGVIADGELALAAKNAGVDVVISKEDLQEFGKDIKAAKKVVNSVDSFIAQADMMPLVDLLEEKGDEIFRNADRRRCSFRLPVARNESFGYGWC